jgi:GxxExxY protein
LFNAPSESIAYQRGTRRMEFYETSKRHGCAIEAHRILGPGLLESTYEQCLAHELKQAGISYKLQHPLPVEYKGIRLDCGHRVDVLVNDELILELKCVEAVKEGLKRFVL